MHLGIDVGSSFLKAALLDLDSGEVREVRRAPFPEFVTGLPAGHREVTSGEILRAVEQLLSQYPRCEGLMISGQMHGFVLLDERGDAVSNYISWQDQRAAVKFRELRDTIGDRDYRRLGNELRPGICLATLYAMHSGAKGVCSLPAYVASKLCAAPVCEEPTNAAALGALDLTTMSWHRGVLERTGLGELHWPEIRPYYEPCGEWRGIPCYPAVGDQQCSLAGSLLREGELSINVSTGSQIAQIASTAETGRHQLRPYFDGRYLKTITHLPAGRALSALVDLLTELGGGGDPWAYIEPAVERTPASDVLADLCFFPGPFGDRGKLANLHENNLTVGHLFRAAYEAMADNYREAATWLGAENPECVVFSGGLVQKSGSLRDAILRRFGAPHRLSPSSEDAMMGLLVLGRRIRQRNQ